MKLNIYQGKQPVKTYTADTYDLMFGTLEDVCKVIKLDDIKTGSEAEIMKMALGVVTESIGPVKDLMKDIFEGITDEDLRRTKVKEMALVLVEVVAYTFNQLNIGNKGKN